MKVLNLRCSRLHSFEGWFASEDDFQDQSRRGLIACPVCADSGVQKMPSAPRLNLGGHPAPSPLAKPVQSPTAGPAEEVALPESGHAAQAAFLTALRQVVAATEDMGERFAEEARRIHYGEAQARAIRGQASARETVELLEEGIAVMPLPMLPALKETLQ